MRARPLPERDRLPCGLPPDRGAAAGAPRIAELVPAEQPDVVRVLARAFRDNPLNVAVVGRGPQQRERSNAHGMRALLAAILGHALVSTVRAPAAGRIAGALIAASPYAYPMPTPSAWAQLRCLFGQGPRTLRRWSQVYARLDEIHPVEPHWYLGVLGVDPDAQRRGLGRALVEHWLRRVDADGAPSYLETDRRENLAFYGRHGFDAVRELSVQGVPVWCMWRARRAAERRS